MHENFTLQQNDKVESLCETFALQMSPNNKKGTGPCTDVFGLKDK